MTAEREADRPALGRSKAPADVTIEVPAGQRMDARPARGLSGAGGSLHGPGRNRMGIAIGGSATERDSCHRIRETSWVSAPG